MPREDRRVYELATHTRCLASFHTDQRNGLNIDEPIQEHPDLGSIVGFDYDKSFGGAAGQWTLTIKKDSSFGPRSALRDLWRDPEDVWVRVKFQVDGQPIDTMLGLIDSISESTARSGSGMREETYTISGRDLGKVFEETKLFVNYLHETARPVRRVTSIMATMHDRIEGTPEHFVKTLLEAWLGNNGGAESQWAMPAGLGGGFFFAHLSDDGVEAMEELVNGSAMAPQLFSPDQGGNALWDSMQEYSNPLLNELFVDLAPTNAQVRTGKLADLKPTLFLRERPFPIRSDDGRVTNHTKWDGLRTHTLRPADVMSRSISKGGAAHRFNYWYLEANGTNSELFDTTTLLQRGVDNVQPGFPGTIPIWNEDSILRHGVRLYRAQTRFLPIYTKKTRANFFRLGARWLKKVHDWYAIAPFELTGTIRASRALPEIRIGTRLREERAEGTVSYYVEGVKHSYRYPGAGSTTLTLTRGEYEDDDLLGFLYEQYWKPRALSAAESCFLREGGEFGLGVSAEDIEELNIMDAQCSIILPSERAFAEGASLDRLSGEVGEGETGFIVRDLEVERDGTSLREPEADEPFRNQLDDTEPQVGTAEEIPTAAEAMNRDNRPQDVTALDREALERGEPIDTGGTDGLDFAETDDPIAGIEDDL